MGSWRIFGWIGSNMTSGNELSDICSLLNLVCNAALRGQAKKFGMLLGLKKLRLHERLRLRSSLDKSVNNSETEKRQGGVFLVQSRVGGQAFLSKGAILTWAGGGKPSLAPGEEWLLRISPPQNGGIGGTMAL